MSKPSGDKKKSRKSKKPPRASSPIHKGDTQAPTEPNGTTPGKAAPSIARIEETQSTVEDKRRADYEKHGDSNEPLPNPLVAGTVDEPWIAERQEEDEKAQTSEETKRTKRTWYITVYDSCKPACSWIWAGCKKATPGGALMVIFTAVVAFATWRYTNLASRQLNTMDSQLREMRDGARPWVGLDETAGDHIYGPWVDPNETVRVDCRVVPKNFGSYPATIFLVHAELVVTQDPNSAMRRMEALRVEPTEHKTGYTLFPGTDRIAEESRLSLFRPKGTLVASRDDRFGLYVIKHILYGDQFGNRHCTQVAYRFENPDADSIQTLHRLLSNVALFGGWQVYHAYAD